MSRKRSRSTKSSGPSTPSPKPTGSGLDCLPFWNEESREWSKKLWWPSESDSGDRHWNYWNGSSDPNYWFSTQLHWTSDTYVPSSNIIDASQHKIDGYESLTTKPPKKKMRPKTKKIASQHEKKPPAGKAKLIKLYPNEEQRQRLTQWFGAARWTYNACVAGVRDGLQRSKKVLREHFVNNDTLHQDPELAWLLEVPYDVRDEGMNDFLKAGVSAWSQATSENQAPQFKFRCKKELMSESIVIHKKRWLHGARSAYAFLHNIKSSEPLPPDILYDSRLTRKRDGSYWFCLLSPVLPQEGPRPRPNVCSIDPGIRTFATVYDPGGRIEEWGSQDMNRIFRLAYRIDSLQSRWSKSSNDGWKPGDEWMDAKQRRKLRQAASRLRSKIKNLVRDLHCKLALHLCRNYQTIILPVFETQSMIAKGQRKIGSKTARAMVTWSHYSFRQRLLAKASEFPGCQVVVVSEAYTSKTCGLCGSIHAKLGGNHTFKCPVCGYTAGRDHNAARNILLRFLSHEGSSNIKSIGPSCDALRPTSFGISDGVDAEMTLD